MRNLDRNSVFSLATTEIFRTPQSFEERTEVTSSCVLKLVLKIPAVVGEMNNSTERAYTGWPDRIYLIDREGRVALKTRLGPFEFDPSQLEAQLQVLSTWRRWSEWGWSAAEYPDSSGTRYLLPSKEGTRP
jgi:hypothetical protein